MLKTDVLFDSPTELKILLNAAQVACFDKGFPPLERDLQLEKMESVLDGYPLFRTLTLSTEN